MVSGGGADARAEARLLLCYRHVIPPGHYMASCLRKWDLLAQNALVVYCFITQLLSKVILVFQKTSAIYPLTPCSCFAAAKVARAGYLFLSKVDNKANNTTYIEIAL